MTSFLAVRRQLRRAGALAVALTLSIGAAAPAAASHLPVDSDPDTVGPAIDSLSISPAFVDVRTANATISANAHLTDDKSGVQTVTVTYRSPSGAQFLAFNFGSFNRVSGDAHVGDYASAITVDTNRESGTWRVSGAATRDVVGNTRAYTADQAREIGAVDFEVLSSRDATPPAVSAVRVSPSVLDVSSGNGFAAFEWDATDAGGSGLLGATISLTSPSGRQLMQGQGFSSTTGVTEATLRGAAITRTFTPTAGFSEVGLSQYSEPGIWRVNFVQVFDRASNVTTYQGAALEAIMGSPFFEVVANPTDTQPPAITAFRFSPHALDVSTSPATVNVEFDVSDDLSGVQAAWLTFRSPTISAASPPFLQRTATYYQPMTTPRLLAGTVTANVTFPTYDRGGDWTVAALCVMDRVKHQRCYAPEERGTLGVTTITVIANEPPIVRVTGVTGGATYETAPALGCDVRDREDGVVSGVTPTVTGGAGGVFTATCTYTDTGGKTGTHTVTYTVTGPSNTAPEASAAGPYAGTEGSPIALDGTAADAENDALSLGWTYVAGPDVDPGAACTFSEPNVEDPTVTCTDDGTYTITMTADDGINPPVEATATVSVGNVDPEVGTASAPLEPLAVGSTAHASVAFGDAGSNDTHTCSIDWGDGGATPGSTAAGACAGSHTYTTTGVYTLRLTVTDDDGGATSALFQYVIVYDPDGGFVTGGGWIDSPAGAYTADPSLNGKASFGFVSKYQKGATVPSGNTEFQFRAATFTFASSSYQWLVVSGAKAQYKGQGAVNGAPGYGFLLTATDGQVSGGGGADKFRIKIWNADGIVYDNLVAATDDLANAQAIERGSIVVHKP